MSDSHNDAPSQSLITPESIMAQGRASLDRFYMAALGMFMAVFEQCYASDMPEDKPFDFMPNYNPQGGIIIRLAAGQFLRTRNNQNQDNTQNAVVASGTWHKEGHQLVQEIASDLYKTGISHKIDGFRVQETEKYIAFAIDDPDAFIRLLDGFARDYGRPLDSYREGSLLRNGQTLGSLILKFKEASGYHDMNWNNPEVQWLLPYVPPRSYTEPKMAFAWMAKLQTASSYTFPIHVQLLKNILTEARGGQIPDGMGLERWH